MRFFVCLLFYFFRYQSIHPVSLCIFIFFTSLQFLFLLVSSPPPYKPKSSQLVKTQYSRFPFLFHSSSFSFPSSFSFSFFLFFCFCFSFFFLRDVKKTGHIPVCHVDGYATYIITFPSSSSSFLFNLLCLYLFIYLLGGGGSNF